MLIPASWYWWLDAHGNVPVCEIGLNSLESLVMNHIYLTVEIQMSFLKHLYSNGYTDALGI